MKLYLIRYNLNLILLIPTHILNEEKEPSLISRELEVYKFLERLFCYTGFGFDKKAGIYLLAGDRIGA